MHPEPEGESFHAAWEPRVLALTLAMGATGLWNIDISRAARETLPDYRELSYYQIWLAGLEKLLAQSGAAQADELAQGRQLHEAVARRRGTARAAKSPRRWLAAPPRRVLQPRAARFAPGQWVRTAPRRRRTTHACRAMRAASAG